jgi:hypothetical protein
MSNLFFSLPAPAPGALAGPWVDVSKLGGQKTIKVSGTHKLPATVVIDICMGDDDDAFDSPLQFSSLGRKTLNSAARMMRVRSKRPMAATVEVAGDSSGSRFTELPLPDRAGEGAIVDVGGFGKSMSVLVSHGKWSGSVNIQVSDDGEHFSDVVTMTTGGLKTFELQGRYMRARRSGVAPSSYQYVPRVDVGAANDAAGEAGALEVNHEGRFVGSRNRVNFVGAGVDVKDDPKNDRVNVQVAGGLAGVGGGSIFMWGAEHVGCDTKRRYLPFGPTWGMAELASHWGFCVPRDGTFRSLFARHNAEAPARATYTLHVNGEATELSCSVNGTGKPGVDRDNAVAVKAGDLVELVVTKDQPINDSRLFAVVTMELV